MIIEIAVGVGILIFAILAFFIIRTLLTLQATLKRVDNLLWDLEIKSKNFDALLRSISLLGDVTEAATEKINQTYFDTKDKEIVKKGDWAEWLLLSLKLGSNFIKRR